MVSSSSSASALLQAETNKLFLSESLSAVGCVSGMLVCVSSELCVLVLSSLKLNGLDNSCIAFGSGPTPDDGRLLFDVDSDSVAVRDKDTDVAVSIAELLLLRVLLALALLTTL